MIVMAVLPVPLGWLAAHRHQEFQVTPDFLQGFFDVRDLFQNYALLACLIPLVTIGGLLVREWAAQASDAWGRDTRSHDED